eukprot:m.127626 g.127626  ORF g.127626 m.127626 type:complete len:65 (-) comp13014_c0_seq3:1965-2159(-)
MYNVSVSVCSYCFALVLNNAVFGPCLFTKPISTSTTAAARCATIHVPAHADANVTIDNCKQPSA